jgi:uncharacterized protein (TIGR03086 family)
MNEQHAAVWKQAASAWDQRWQAVQDDQWQAQSTCDAWDVQALCDHTIQTQATFAASMVGAQVAPDAAWPEVHAAISACLEDPSCLDGTAEMPGMGEVPKAMLFGIASSDMLIHSWDLARSIGADETLPQEAVTACYMGLQKLPEAGRLAEGRFKASVECAPDADTQTQFLSFSGRTV